MKFNFNSYEKFEIVVKKKLKAFKFKSITEENDCWQLWEGRRNEGRRRKKLLNGRKTLAEGSGVFIIIYSKLLLLMEWKAREMIWLSLLFPFSSSWWLFLCPLLFVLRQFQRNINKTLCCRLTAKIFFFNINLCRLNQKCTQLIKVKNFKKISKLKKSN